MERRRKLSLAAILWVLGDLCWKEEDDDNDNTSGESDTEPQKEISKEMFKEVYRGTKLLM